MEKDTVNPGFKILLIGGSAGSLEVLVKMLPQLSFPILFAMVIVVHRKNTEDSTLEELIAFKTSIPVKEIEDKTPLLPGFIYVAPSDYHLLFEKNGLLSLDTSEKINYSRPSIDVCFESAAAAYGPAVMGMLLSGSNADGTLGLSAIKNAGGITVVQDPETAEMGFMPNSAIISETPDYILTPDMIAGFISAIK